MKSKLFILFLSFAGVQSAHSQFVDIEIRLSVSNHLKVIDGDNGLSRPDFWNTNTKIAWIGLSLSDNVSLTIRPIYKKLEPWDRKEPVVFQNNGTTNLGSAIPILESHRSFEADSKVKYPDKSGTKASDSQVWLGLPVLQLKSFAIEYN